MKNKKHPSYEKLQKDISEIITNLYITSSNQEFLNLLNIELNKLYETKNIIYIESVELENKNDSYKYLINFNSKIIKTREQKIRSIINCT